MTLTEGMPFNMDEWLNALNAWLATNPGWINAAIAGTAVLESLAIAGLVVPGVAMLFVIAAVAGNHELSAWAAMAWACFGAIVGDGLSFWFGRYFKERLPALWPFSRYPAALNRGVSFFQSHGGKSVVLGRFVGPIRPIIPMVAGAFGMDGRRFVLFNVLSAIGWAPLYILPGYLVGASLAREPDLPPHFYPILLLGLVTVVSLLALFFRLHLGLLPQGRLYKAMESYLQRHPRIAAGWHSLARPREKQHEFPLPSAALAVGAIILFTTWTLIVIHTQWLVDFNSATMLFFQELRLPLLDPLFTVITLSGDALLLGAGFALFAGLLLWGGYRAAALHMVAAGIAVTILTTGLKYGLYLARPETVDLPPVTPAYPSGHSSGATVLYGLLGAFVAQEFPRRQRWRIYAMAALPIFLVALSRLYLGVHWFTDTVGGVLLGLAICGIIRVSYSRYDRRPLPLQPFLGIALLVWLLFIAGYCALRWHEAVSRYAPVLT